MTASILKTALAAALVTVSITASASAGTRFDRTVAINNLSDGEIWSVHISHIDANSWGRDLLGDYVLSSNSYDYFEPEVINGYCRFDVRVEFSNRAVNVVHDVNLCEVLAVEVDDYGYENLIW